MPVTVHDHVTVATVTDSLAWDWASVKGGNGNGNWKLEMVVKYSCCNQEYLWQQHYIIEYSEVASSSRPSSILVYIEKLGGPEDEASTQLTSY